MFQCVHQKFRFTYDLCSIVDFKYFAKCNLKISYLILMCHCVPKQNKVMYEKSLRVSLTSKLYVYGICIK